MENFPTTLPPPGSQVTIPIAEYLSLPHPDHNWLISGIIAKPTYVLLLGDGKSGKSTLALQMSLAVANGIPFMGFPTRKGRVLYLQCDVSDFTWRLMLSNFKTNGESLQGNVFLVNPLKSHPYLDVLSKTTLDYLKEIRDSCHPDMVVLDVLCEFHRSDEQDATSMRIILNLLLKVFEGTGLLIVHHTSKLDPTLSADPIRSSRGSSYIPNRADNVLLLHQSRLCSRGRFGVPLSLTLRRKPSGFWFRV